MRNGDLTVASDALHRALDIDPHSFVALNKLGTVLARQGNRISCRLQRCACPDTNKKGCESRRPRLQPEILSLQELNIECSPTYYRPVV
jgi:hypothetical protein